MTNCVSRYAIVMAALLAVATPAAAQQAQAGNAQTPPPGQTPRASTGRAHADSDSDRSAPQAFSVVLVLGEAQASTMQDNVPAAARKALADMKDFLPYKGYRLLDTQWTLCCGNYPITSRLKGDDQEYELQLSASLVAEGRVTVRFYLSEASPVVSVAPSPRPAETSAQIAELEQQLSKLRIQYKVNSERVGDHHPDQVRLAAEIAAVQQMIAARADERVGPQKVRSFMRSGSPAIIDTSFRMDVGETVVVGTSRTKGDKALIALLTAVPAKAPTAR